MAYTFQRVKENCEGNAFEEGTEDITGEADNESQGNTYTFRRIGVNQSDQTKKFLRAIGLGEVDFSADVTSGNAPLAVNFTPSVTGNFSEFDWTFGDSETGNSTDLTPISHEYDAAGTYTVEMTAYPADLCIGDPITISKPEYITVEDTTVTVSPIFCIGFNPSQTWARDFYAYTSGTYAVWLEYIKNGGSLTKVYPTQFKGYIYSTKTYSTGTTISFGYNSDAIIQFDSIEAAPGDIFSNVRISVVSAHYFWGTRAITVYVKGIADPSAGIPSSANYESTAKTAASSSWNGNGNCPGGECYDWENLGRYYTNDLSSVLSEILF